MNSFLSPVEEIIKDLLCVAPEFGKKIGGDISSNKKTYLIIKLLEKANSTDKESVLKLMNDNSENENKIKFITDMMLKYQIDKIAKQKMDIYYYNFLISHLNYYN